MLSDEEKDRIIEELKLQKAYAYKFNNPQIKMITDCALNLIEKQSKEIEELKQIKCKLDEKNIPIETLLAEFERLEDLEDDLTTVYLNGVYDGEKKVEDKIKAKIEEYREQIEELKDLNIFTYTEYEGAIKFGQSLLEKE